MTPAHSQSLTGCTVAITAQRYAEELAAALIHRGAVVRPLPALSLRSHVDDAELLAQTRRVPSDPPADPSALFSAARWAASGEVDAVVFTSATGATRWLAAVEDQGLLGRIRSRSAAGTLVLACLGPASAAPLAARAVRTLQPDRRELGALVRALSGQLEAGARAGLSTSAGVLVVRSGGAVLDGVPVPVSPGPLAVLRALVEAGGDVRSREQLLQVLPGESVDPHAAEVAIARLRESLGVPGLIGTVVKRGYRLVTAGGAPSDDAVM